MAVDANSITWLVHRRAADDLETIKADLGDDEYFEGVASLRDWLCEYFDTTGCTSKFQSSISPIGSNSTGGKILKVRWLLPGAGKRGGLRICVVAYCERLTVVICRAFPRKDEPSDDEFEDGAELATQYPGK